MISFKVNNQKVFFPTCWEDLSFSQYVARLSPDYTYTLIEEINLFTGIPRETLANAELKNLESISIALAFLNVPPGNFSAGPSKMVGKYTLPKDVTIQSTGQFEDLKALITKIPKQLETREDNILIADLYLEACAIYVQKIKSASMFIGEKAAYNSDKVPEVKEELKNYSCMEVIQTGAFFLFKPLNLSLSTMSRSQSIRQRLKKLSQDFPGFQKTLDLLLPSSRKAKE